VDHLKNKGLAANYNEGMELAKTDHVIVMHQDIFLQDKHSFSKATEPFKKPDVVVTHPFFIYPYSIWVNDGFWQKVLFSRLVDKKQARLSGKFDCIDKRTGVRFDSRTYRTAGEDFDFETRLKEHGEVAQADLEVTHLQSNEENFPLKKLVKKEAQLAECYGVNLRRHFRETPMADAILVLARPMMLLLLLVPYINVVIALLLATYILLCSKDVFIKCWRDPRVLALPFVNLGNVFIYSYYFVRGLLNARQMV
jgi:glycosyltransferase involved in cell wall biosynthesis